jgi:hypothetical protein
MHEATPPPNLQFRAVGIHHKVNIIHLDGWIFSASLPRGTSRDVSIDDKQLSIL